MVICSLDFRFCPGMMISLYAGHLKIVNVTKDLKLKECDDGTSYRISFEDLAVGWDVLVLGTFVGDDDVAATKII